MQAYNLNTLTDVQRTTLKDLADLGLVKLQQVGSFVIYFFHYQKEINSATVREIIEVYHILNLLIFKIIIGKERQLVYSY